MKVSYNWLKWYVPDMPAPDKLADVFTYHLTEVESMEKLADGDTVFDLNILPNRAHDLLSFHGVARELSGQLGIKFNDPTPMYKVPESKPTDLKIEADPARRYMGRIIRNVKVGPPPDWVKMHLESIGERSINNVVDATNITMYDCGQPCHAFDLDKLKAESGKVKVIIRNAKAGEKMTTLDTKEVELKETDLVITDGENILAIAGVKGRKIAEVDANTKNILIEVANFDPVAVRKTSRRLGILTDSSKRFENDLSPELCSFGMLELSALFVEYGFTDFEEIVDVYPNKQAERKIHFDVALVTKKLGADISADEIEKILKNYAFTYTRANESFEIIAPTLRLDLVVPEDMVEEIGRIVGYDKVVPTIPKIDFTPATNETFAKICAAREKLLADGYGEVTTYAFAKKGDIEVARGAKGKEFLRTNLSDGLKASYELNKLNAPFLGVDEIKIFEIGTVFPKNSEEIHVATADKKGVTELSLDDFCSKNSLNLLSTFNFQLSTRNKSFVPWSAFPFIARDIAVWVPEDTDPLVLVDILKEKGTELLVREPRLFDTFTKDSRTSYAFSLIFQAFNRTLTDGEVQIVMENIAGEIGKHPDWNIR